MRKAVRAVPHRKAKAAASRAAFRGTYWATFALEPYKAPGPGEGTNHHQVEQPPHVAASTTRF